MENSSLQTVAIGDNRNFSEEELAQLTQQHGKIKQFEVEDRIVCFRQPTRAELALLKKNMVKNRDVESYTNSLLNTTQLNYKEETRNNVELYEALAAVSDQVVTTLTATLKNS